MSSRHRFRFFVEEAAAVGDVVALAPADAVHVRVLRLDDGEAVDLVDSAGRLWDARVTGSWVQVEALRTESTEPAMIELVAGALVGGRFDELVDGAVQAGAARVVPFVTTRRDRERLAARRGRLQRIARAAAKQAQRTIVPDVREPIGEEALLAGGPGIVLDSQASEMLDQVVADAAPSTPLRLLVGAADGLDPTLVTHLVEGGWRRARLGPTVLRAELAAAVAVAIAAMHAPRVGSSAAGVGRDG